MHQSAFIGQNNYGNYPAYLLFNSGFGKLGAGSSGIIISASISAFRRSRDSIGVRSYSTGIGITAGSGPAEIGRGGAGSLKAIFISRISPVSGARSVILQLGAQGLGIGLGRGLVSALLAPNKLGIATAANKAMMATTIIISTKVKPLFLFNIGIIPPFFKCLIDTNLLNPFTLFFTPFLL